jgi:hypothetical protein
MAVAFPQALLWQSVAKVKVYDFRISSLLEISALAGKEDVSSSF